VRPPLHVREALRKIIVEQLVEIKKNSMLWYRLLSIMEVPVTVPTPLLSDIYRRHFTDFIPDDKTGPRRKKGRGKAFDAILAEQFVHLVPSYPEYTYTKFKAEMIDRIDDIEPDTPDRGCVCFEAALAEYLDETNIEISENGQRLTRLPHTDVTAIELRESMKIWCANRNKPLSKEDTNYSADLVLAQLVDHMQVIQCQSWINLCEDIKYNKSAGKKVISNIGKMLKSVRVDETNEDKFRADRLMLAHFIWTVKRRILKKDPNPALPFMLVFKGRQGGGKTSLVKKHFASPLHGKITDASLGDLHVANEFRKWTDNAIVLFDELSYKGLAVGSRNRTPEVLKELITASESTNRTMYTQSQQSHIVRAAFIATTNKELAESICDPTGMRRFWVIDCGTTENQPEFDWDVIEDFDWLALWQGIDENRAKGYLTVDCKLFPVIETEQDKHCIQPSLERWFRDEYETYRDDRLRGMTSQAISRDEKFIQEGVKTYSQLSLYGDYTARMQELQNYAVSQSNFIGQIIKLGAAVVPQSKTKAKTLHFVVKQTREQ